MADSTFFDEAREQSRIKSRIVAKYFWAWAKVIMAATTGRIAYMDLFSGPGVYGDKTPSTPVIVLEKAITDTVLRQRLVTVFNDRIPEFTESLKTVVNALPGVETLKFRPRIETQEVGQKIVESFKHIRLIPTFLFVDPWGYKGLSVALIATVLKSWGCDCVFFFNYNRINPGLSNQFVREHMDDLFGQERAENIRARLAGLQPTQREELIIEELSLAFRERGIRYILPFTFKNEEGTRTSHHLIFASKAFKGYEIMKEIMAGESSERDQGVASFAYSPVSREHQFVFEFSRPLSDLEDTLLEHFAGQTLSMHQIYERHNVGRRYIKTNYKKALTRLEAASKIAVDPPADKRLKKRGEVTFADDVIVKFPRGA